MHEQNISGPGFGSAGQKVTGPQHYFHKSVSVIYLKIILMQLSSSQQQVEDEKKTNDIVKTDIWFRFKEGYSNAVRRKVKISNLL